jgi:hypothetical protein
MVERRHADEECEIYSLGKRIVSYKRKEIRRAEEEEKAKRKHTHT